jgi:uncharacterized protein (DUF736 family)
MRLSRQAIVTSPLHSCWRRSIRGLDEACLTGNRLRLDRPPATAIRDFLPLPDPTPLDRSNGDPEAPPFLAKQESRVSPPSISFRPFGCGPIVPGLCDSHRGRNGAARNTKRNTTMATIGTFTSTENGFTGSIRTLALNVKARISRVENPSDKGPHYRIFAANVELGAAWQKRSEQTGRDYLSVKLDDPSFPGPIYATLTEVEGEDGYQLIWSRPNRD